MKLRKAKLPLGAQDCDRIRKPKFHVFWFFTPLFGRFRLSSVFQTTGLEEIYRLILKILDFMPCGSLFSRFWVEIHGHPQKSMLKSMEMHGNRRKSMEIHIELRDRHYKIEFATE